MLIFIDESGTFSAPNKYPIGVSCVAGLMIPHRRYGQLSKAFRSLKISWGIPPSVEVKSSALNEEQIFQVINLLLANRATCCAVIYDGSLSSPSIITAQRLSQGRASSIAIDHQYSNEIRRHFLEIRRKLRKMPNQLFIQAKALISLAEDCLATILIEYPQTHPSELGNIEVYVDAKDKVITPFEEYWKSAILPELQARSARSPLGMIEGVDYSHFNKRYRCFRASIPPHLNIAGTPNSKPFEYTNLGEIFRDIKIEQSHHNIGLQLADVVANTLTRILKGNLQISGWRKYPQLFIRKSGGSLTLLAFEELTAEGSQQPYYGRIQAIHNHARSAAIHRFIGKPRVRH